MRAMNDRDWLAAQFEEQRPRLRRIAYRMLGTVDETDDAVQETWLRLNRTDHAAVDNLSGWLTTVVGRVCLDMLRARTARRETSAGSWLPEPIVVVDDEPTPEEEALIADGVGLALLVVLETLTPAERLAFVLHDMFGVPFEEIAQITGRSPTAARQLASRARRQVRGASPSADADLTEQRRAVDAFLKAAREGDFEALLAVLDPDVVFRFDPGAGRPLAGAPISGASAVAERVLSRARLARFARKATVNGGAGILVEINERPFAVIAFTVSGGRITEIDLVTDQEKLTRVRR
jgi:RNA polymerase sigma-70 factor (ECF subfamily)